MMEGNNACWSQDWPIPIDNAEVTYAVVKSTYQLS